MIIKIRRREFTVTEKDRVLFNGACYTIMTQEVLEGWSWAHPTLPKTTAARLIKEGKMVLCEDKYQFPHSKEQYDKYRFVINPEEQNEE